MDTTSPNTNPSKKTSLKTNWKFLGKFLLIVAAIVLIPCVIADVAIRLKFAAVTTAVADIQRDVIQPAKGIAHTERYSKGNGLLDILSCLPDASCPSTTQEWFVPLPSDKQAEDAFAQMIMQTEGYRSVNTYGHQGKKNDLTLYVTFNPIGNVQPPAPAPTGKQWVFVLASVY